MATSNSKFERAPKTQRRVVVTGMAALTPVGLDMQTSWKNLVNGVSGIDNITQFDTTKHDVKFAGEIKGFDPSPYIEKKEQKKMDRFIHLSLAATAQAVEDSGLKFDEQLVRAPVVYSALEWADFLQLKFSIKRLLIVVLRASPRFLFRWLLPI
jgi:hypothetical protein